MNLKILAPVIGITLVVLAISFQVTSTPETIANPIEPVAIDFESTEFTIMETNGIKHLIPLDKIRGGGPPKDGIPSIDNPVFADIQGSHFMSDSDTVIGLEINGEAKAYPIFILVWHEIANDKVGETPMMLISLYSENSRAFERTINGMVLDFEYTEGKIFDSQTNSEWNYDRLSVSGEYHGEKLERMPIEPGFWFEWFAFHPQTLVYGDK